MSANIEMNLRELDGVREKLEKARLSPQERKKLLASVAQLVEMQSKERFDTQTDPDGNRWKEISAVTAAYYRKKFITHRSLLFISGFLRESIESQVNSWQAVIGATRIYAATHQYGAEKGQFGRTKRNAPIPWGRIPPRPYLGLNDENVSEISRCVDEYLAEKIK